VVLGTLSGVTGKVIGSSALQLGFVAPGGYALAILAGSAVNSPGLPPRARMVLPVVFATMHFSWGAGFLLSPKSLA
jgi:hypothetical protein